MKIYELYEDENCFYIVTEFLGGGELYERIISNEESLTENDAAKIMQQILKGVFYCHSNKIVHRFNIFINYFFF